MAAAKRRRDAWTPEALRMGALFRALQARGETQQHIADTLEIDQTYVSYIAKAPDGTPRGIGAELVRKVLEEYKIDPWYFYDFPTNKIPDWARYVIERGRAPAHAASEPQHHETVVRKKSPR
jgi:transcriptional regulator with XRE-family HTH domain